MANYAKITSISGFNDELNPSIRYTNVGYVTEVKSLELQVIYWSQNPVSANVIATRTGLSNTYTGQYVLQFTTAERNKIREFAASSESIELEFQLWSNGDGWVTHDSWLAECEIVNADPTFTFSIVDTNTSVINVTGDSSIIVNHYSKPKLTVTASAKKYATIAGIRGDIGGDSYQVLNSSSFTHTYSEVLIDKVFIIAADSRGKRVSVNTTFGDNFVDYIPLGCVVSVDSVDFTNDEILTTKFKVEGGYYNGNIGKTPNSLRASYRYRLSGGSYSSWTSISPTKSSDKYSTVISIQSSYTDTIEIEVNISDALASQIKTYKHVAKPVFDWGEEDFNFNVPVTVNGNLDATGNATVDGKLDVGSNVTVGGQLEVTGYTGLNGTVLIRDCYPLLVVDYGNSGNWRWRKYSDGSAECWSYNLYYTAAVTTADGNIYVSGKCISPDFPFTFIEKPEVNITMNTGYAQGWIIGTGSGGTHTSTTNPGSFQIARSQSYANGTYYVSIHARGRWDYGMDVDGKLE